MEPLILDVDMLGQKRKAILHPSKNGFAYLYDRETGKFLHGFPYATPNWAQGLDKNGRALGAIRPADQKEFLICPAMSSGARGINHSAYSPRTGWWYTTDYEVCSYIKNGLQPAPQEMLNPKTPPNISAFDPVTGKREWTFDTNYPNQSSQLATAGDLIFGGDLEGNAFALDAKTGKKLWSFNTGGRISGPPVSYSVNGRQYVTISSGGGSSTEERIQGTYPKDKNRFPQPSSTLFVFALPEKNK